jgi:hypothetical protein
MDQACFKHSLFFLVQQLDRFPDLKGKVGGYTLIIMMKTNDKAIIMRQWPPIDLGLHSIYCVLSVMRLIFILNRAMGIAPLVQLSATSNTNKTAIDITKQQTGGDNNTEIQPQTENTQSTTETAQALNVNQQQQALTDDQRELVAGGVYIGTQTDLLPDFPIGMHADNFSHTDMFAQQTKIAGFNWDPTATVGTILYQVAIPDVFNQVCSLSRNMLQVYAFFKPTVTIRFQINATRFQCGKLLIFADPANYWFDQSNRSIYSASAMPFVEIDVSSSNSAELTIPFEYVSNYLLTTTSNPLGPNALNDSIPLASVRVLVLNPLQNQAGDNTPIQVAAYMRMDAVEPNVAVYQHDLFVENPVSLTEHLSMHKNQGIGETVSKGAEVVGDVADKVSGIAKTVGNAAKDFFNLDRPTLPDAHSLGHLSTTAPLSYMFGKDTCVRLSTNPLANYMDNKFSLSSRDETSIDKIIQQPTLIAQSDWSSSMGAEAEILNIPVCPYSNHFTSPDRAEYDVINPSWLEYIGFYHNQWSGDIIYRLSFASTQIHSGRLQISFEPGVDITPITGGPTCPVTIQRSSMPYAIFDLREHKEFVFRVSYVGTTETKSFRPSPEVGEMGNIGMLHKTGNLRVTVLTPLRVSSDIATTIQMNTWIAGAPNFRYDYPQRSRSVINRDDFARLPPIPPTPHRNQVGGQGYLYPELNTQPIIGAGTDASARSLPLSGPNLLKSVQIRSVRDRFGERVSDVRDLAKRPSCYYYNIDLIEMPDTNRKSAQIGFQNSPVGVLNAPISAGTSDNMLYNFAQMYAYWCGAIRYKVIPRTSRNDALHTICSFAPPTDSFAPTISDTLVGPLHIQNCSQDNGVEVEVPYISTFTQLLTRNKTATDTPPYTTTGIVLILFDYDIGTDKTRASGVVAVSAGNDIAFRWLCFPPLMYCAKYTP